jgi:membrane-associated phospholipid phosphatase
VASTVLVKQHYLADVVGGLVLAAVTSLIVMRAIKAA